MKDYDLFHQTLANPLLRNLIPLTGSFNFQAARSSCDVILIMVSLRCSEKILP